MRSAAIFAGEYRRRHPRFSGRSKKRVILTDDEIQALVAFLVALTTDTQLGETDALQLRDIGDDRLFIRHA